MMPSLTLDCIEKAFRGRAGGLRGLCSGGRSWGKGPVRGTPLDSRAVYRLSQRTALQGNRYVQTADLRDHPALRQ